MKPIPAAILSAAVALALILLGVLPLVGCASTKDRADSAANSGHATLARIDAHADAAADDIDFADGCVDEAMNAPDAPPSTKLPLAKAKPRLASARGHVRAIQGETPKVASNLTDLQGYVAKALDASLAPYRTMAIVGGVLIALSLAVLWWTDKPRYAFALFILGAGLCVVAWFAGFAHAHPWYTAGAVAAVAAGVVAFEWVRHPESVRSVLDGFRAASHKPQPAAGQTAAHV